MILATVSTTASHILEHWQDGLAYVGGFSFLAHMVNSAPVPKNEWGAWILGGFQFIVGQRNRAANTIRGDESHVVSTGPPESKMLTAVKAEAIDKCAKQLNDQTSQCSKKEGNNEGL